MAGRDPRAARRLIGKRRGGNEIAPPQFGDIDTEPARRDLHDALKREIELRPAVTTVEPDRRAIGDDDLVVDRNVLHVITAVRGGVHTVQRRRLRRADIGALVGDVLEAQADELTVISECRGNFAQAVARRGSRRETLAPLLDPLYPPPRLTPA